MLIANNATNKMFLTNYGAQNSRLQTSLARLSSGNRILTPGEAPADLGISERFRSQVRKSEEASRVIQNGVNLFQTADSYLQQVHDILNRMSELAVAASDDTKNAGDLKNLNLEFQQLKSEVKRISEDGKYNGLQINGKTSVAVYDTLDHKIKFSQPDGSETKTLDISLKDGNSASNGIEYAFESASTAQNVGDYMFTDDGRSLLYIAQKDAGANVSARKTLMKLDIENNTITTLMLASAGGAHATDQARLVMDDQGRVWVSDPSTAGGGNSNFNVKLLDTDSMQLHAGGTGSAWGGSVKLASSFSEFSVHGDYMYFIERSGGGAAGKLNYVKRHLQDTTDKQVLIADLSSSSINMDKSENYSISADGQYIAFEDDDAAADGVLVVLDVATGDRVSYTAGSRSNSIVALGFDANNNLFWTDTGNTSDDNAVKRLSLSRDKDGKLVRDAKAETIYRDTNGRIGAYNSAVAGTNAMGLSVGGGSPGASYTFQVGADAGQNVTFESGDVRLTRLGISSLDVSTQEHAQEAIAKLATATDKVANQRAIIGAQVSRLNFIHTANEGYRNNIAAAESRIRDVDIANETSELTKAQILAQTSVSVLAQSNSAQQNVLRLLQ